jgi:hypothetical protein
MILVNPDTGDGYVIQGKTSNGILIEPNLTISATKLAVVPKYQFYRSRREARYFLESYNIGCHAHGDPLTAIWLWTLVKYSLLRYNEALLEGRCFQNMAISSTDLIPNENYGGPNGENVFSRFISLSGQARYSWLKTPVRTIEAVDIVDRAPLSSGIKIISNLDSEGDLGDFEQQTWITTDGED